MSRRLHDGYTALKAMCAGYDSLTIATYLIEEDRVWRDKGRESGATRIRNCLSPDKREFFHFSEIIAITRFTHQFDAVEYFCDEVGLSIPHPIDVGEQIQRLEQSISDATTQLCAAADKLSRIKADPESQKVTTLRPRSAQFSKPKYPVQEF